MSESIINQLKDMPELLSSKDLVKIGMFRNSDAAYLARLRGHSPDYIKIGGLVKYPKTNVIAFINSRIISGTKSEIAYVMQESI